MLIQKKWKSFCFFQIAVFMLVAVTSAQAERTFRYISDAHPENINPRSWAEWRATMNRQQWETWRDSLTDEQVQFLRASVSPQNFKSWHKKMRAKDIALWQEFEARPVTIGFKGKAFVTY